MPIMRKFNTKAMKVNSQRVKEMYDRIQAGELTQGAAAAIYGLGVIQVGRIARGESRAQETGAHENPVPNFNLRVTEQDADASAARLRDLMADNQPKPSSVPSLYSDPPPLGYDDSEGSGLDKLNRLQEPTARQKQVGDELDKFTKGD